MHLLLLRLDSLGGESEVNFLAVAVSVGVVPLVAELGTVLHGLT